MPPLIRIRSLGPVQVAVGAGPAPRELLWRKNLALLVYLARSPRLRRTREHLVGLLWGGSAEAAARHSLNEALRVLRRHGGEGLVVSDARQVELSEGAVWLDVDALEERVAWADFGGAADLVGGEFMEGFGIPDASAFEDWLAAERTHWRRRVLEALVGRVRERLERGDLAAAREACDRALALDPLSEDAVREAMRVAALGGDRAGALTIFEEFGERARRDLGLEPDPDTVRLADRIRRERSWHLPEELAAAEAPRRTPLVGREEDLEKLLGAWRRAAAEGRACLLTVEGTAGVGKTRILEEVASRARLEGAVVAAIRAVPSDRESPWSGLAGLASGGLVEAPGLVVAPPGALAGVAELAPAWRERFAGEIRGAEPDSPGRAFSRVAGVAAEEQPLLLAVDDARWLDPDSAGALDALLRDHADRPVALLVAAGAYPRDETLDRMRARVGRELEGASVHLERLEKPELGELARHAFPDYDAGSLDRLARRLEADTAGLPLLAVELLGAVELGLELGEIREAWPAARRTLDQTLPGELPDAIVAAIRVGFGGLGEDAREVLLAAVVLGPRVDAGTLAAATGLPPERLRPALDELEWSRWLASEPRGYAFVAALARDILERDMVTPGRRRAVQDAAGASGE